ncbi:MAG: hypothetical protein WAM14_06035 [Candidatus Nitrosopolaris sp.]
MFGKKETQIRREYFWTDLSTRILSIRILLMDEKGTALIAGEESENKNMPYPAATRLPTGKGFMECVLAISLGNSNTEQNVSGSMIIQIWCQYRNTMTVPILAKPGRPSRSITNEEISAIIGTYKEYPSSAVVLETILDNRHG